MSAVIQKANNVPIYISKRTAVSLWQEYRVYPDRLELESRFLLHTLVVPATEVQSVEVRGPGLIWGVKLDICNFCTHVLVTKKSGLFNQLCFSPGDPHKFVATVRAMLAETVNSR